MRFRQKSSSSWEMCSLLAFPPFIKSIGTSRLRKRLAESWYTIINVVNYDDNCIQQSAGEAKDRSTRQEIPDFT